MVRCGVTTAKRSPCASRRRRRRVDDDGEREAHDRLHGHAPQRRLGPLRLVRDADEAPIIGPGADPQDEPRAGCPGWPASGQPRRRPRGRRGGLRPGRARSSSCTASPPRGSSTPRRCPGWSISGSRSSPSTPPATAAPWACRPARQSLDAATASLLGRVLDHLGIRRRCSPGTRWVAASSPSSPPSEPDAGDRRHPARRHRRRHLGPAWSTSSGCSRRCSSASAPVWSSTRSPPSRCSATPARPQAAAARHPDARRPRPPPVAAGRAGDLDPAQPGQRVDARQARRRSGSRCSPSTATATSPCRWPPPARRPPRARAAGRRPARPRTPGC